MAVESEDLEGAGPFAPPELVPSVRKRRRIIGTAPREVKTAAGDTVAVSADPVASREQRPKTRRQSTAAAATSGKRKSLASTFAAVYGGAGSLAERSGDPRMLPTARVLQWNSAVAGEAIDDLIAGTFVDKMVQPLAKKGDKVQKVTNVVGLPLVIYALTNRPELWGVLEPMARQMFYENLASMGPVIAAKRKRDKEVAKIVDDMHAEGMIGTKDDGSVPSPDDLFAMLFAPPPGYVPPDE